MSDDDDDLFEVDLDEQKHVYVYDVSPDRTAQAALTHIGLESRVVRLGSELMSAAQDNRVRGVVVASDTDPELRELFMRAFRGRFPAIPVVYLSVEAGKSDHVAAFRAEGAHLVLPWPLPPAEVTLSTMQSLFAAAPQRTTPEGDTRVRADQQLLARKVDGLESAARPSTDPAIPKAAFDDLVRETAKKSVENTELRGELTLVRERNAMLEDRAKRLAKEIQSLSRELEALRLEARGSGTPVDESNTLNGAALEGLLAGVETYGWGLEQAIQYFEELKLKVGSRAPSLDGHLRTLRLVRALLDRLRELPGVSAGPPPPRP